MIKHPITVLARGWLGTPYQHQASLKGVGCDCLGLVRGLWRETFGAEPEVPPAYAPDWAEAGLEETLAEAGRRHLIEIHRWYLKRVTCCCSVGSRIFRPNMQALPLVAHL